MSSINVFRSLILAQPLIALVIILSMVFSFDSLPPELQDYILTEEPIGVALGIGMLALLLASIAAFILCWQFKPSGRLLYIITIVMGYLLGLFAGTTILSPFMTLLYDLAMMTEGALLVMLFTGETGRRFNGAASTASQAVSTEHPTGEASLTSFTKKALSATWTTIGCLIGYLIASVLIITGLEQETYGRVAGGIFILISISQMIPFAELAAWLRKR